MKVSKKRIHKAIVKLDACIATIDKIRDEVFLKECVGGDLERIGDWIEEAMGLIGGGQ